MISSLSQGPCQEWLSNKCALLFRGRVQLCRLRWLQLTHPFITPESNQWWTLGQPCSPATRERWAPFAFRVDDSICNSHYLCHSWLCSLSMRKLRDQLCGALSLVFQLTLESLQAKMNNYHSNKGKNDGPSTSLSTKTLLRLSLPPNDWVRPTHTRDITGRFGRPH